jgi:hypothetical protein
VWQTGQEGRREGGREGGHVLTIPFLEFRSLLVFEKRHANVHFTPASGADVLHQGTEARMGVDAAVRDVGRIGDRALR